MHTFQSEQKNMFPKEAKKLSAKTLESILEILVVKDCKGCTLRNNPELAEMSYIIYWVFFHLNFTETRLTCRLFMICMSTMK